MVSTEALGHRVKAARASPVDAERGALTDGQVQVVRLCVEAALPRLRARHMSPATPSARVATLV
jgi:hypothetical protein